MDAGFFEQTLFYLAGGKELHGLFFWGHGNEYGVTTNAAHRGDARFQSLYITWESRLNYRLALGILFTCDSQSAYDNYDIFTRHSIFWGAPGDLWPHGFHLFGPTVAALVPPGAQGTKR